MYVCVNCGQLFEMPAHVTEKHGFDYPPYEEVAMCPFCGGDFVETYQCEECGEYIDGEYIQLANGECYCQNCYEVLDVRD